MRWVTLHRLTYDSPELLSLWKDDLELLLSRAVQVAPDFAVPHLDAVDPVLTDILGIYAQPHPAAYGIK